MVRDWINESFQKIEWFTGPRRNIRNLGGKCLDVAGGKNADQQHVIWWNCHNGLNQAWKLERRGFTYSRNPLNDGIRF